MEIINNFERKGGTIIWREDFGPQSVYVSKSVKMLMSKPSWIDKLKSYIFKDYECQDKVFRCTEEEWINPASGYIRIKTLFG